MEGSIRSGGVLKKKSSSGCLIIKKKGENKNSAGGFGGLSENFKEQKRARLVLSDSGDSGPSDEDESLEFMRRKASDKRLHNGSMGYKRSEVENREYHRNNAGVEVGGGRKRSRLNSFEFNEYNEFNEENRGNLKEFGVGSSRRDMVVDKRNQNSYFDGSSSGRRGKGLDYGGLRNNGLEEDESNEPIRLQGKNGVLKVMVNKKKKMDIPSHLKRYDQKDVLEREVYIKKEFPIRSPSFPASRMRPENRGLFIEKEKIVEKEIKREVKLEKAKPDLSKCMKGRELESDETDTMLKLAPPGPISKKTVKKEEIKPIPQENVTPVKGKEVVNEVKAANKRGGNTEKQMLREKIRGMLIESGWTIDYRPRRNRDYLDAVYINPSGTAYWSIIKAYDAFKKHLGEDSNNTKSKSDVVGSPSFAPLSEDLINKLTRQTKKKIEQELKRKRKEENLAKSAAKKSAVRESSDSDRDEGDNVSDDSPKRKLRKSRVEKKPSNKVLQGRTSKIIGRCTLLVRGSDKGENSESDGYIPYTGKRTLLAWLIDSGTAQLSEKVQYMNKKRTKAILEGWITREGIHCGCCSKILAVSKFELHAGSKLRQPYHNIFLESGNSLLQCQVDAWNKLGESESRDFCTVGVDGDDPDDDTCGLCGDGGALICCDSCPSTFHQICLGIQKLPSGDWHCPNCICKFCGNVAEENDGTADELMRCSFCEKKYHISCSEEVPALPMSSSSTSFCGLTCQELYDHLQKILGVKNELEGGFSWSLIQQADISDTSHRGFPQRVENNSKLAVALSVMDECFLPIIDRRSRINMIHNVVYNCGSNFNRLNYRGFYTVVLERGDEIVSAASIRIHGTCLAEMPFIATREIYRRQGMCRRLLSAIEAELCSLKVEHLVIPAIAEHMNTWTTAFGFRKLDDVLKKEIKSMNMLVFPGTDMLQKEIVKQEIPDGMKVKDEPQLPVFVEKSDTDSPMEDDKPMSKTSDEINTPDSGSPAPAVPSNDNIADSVCDATTKNEQKQLSASFKNSPSTPDETDMENGELDPPVKDNIVSSLEAAPETIPDNGSVQSQPGFVFESETTAQSTAGKATGENTASSPMKDVVNEDPGSVFETTAQSTAGKATLENIASSSPTKDVVNEELGSVFETTAQSTAGNATGENIASSPTKDVINDELGSVLEATAQSTAGKDTGENIASSPMKDVVNEEPGSILETTAQSTAGNATGENAASSPTKDVANEEPVVETELCSSFEPAVSDPKVATVDTNENNECIKENVEVVEVSAIVMINENKKPAPVSTLPDSEEIEMALEVDGKVEKIALAENTKITEDHTE